jgi:hypothetical protein
LLQWSSLIISISLEMAIFSYRIGTLMKKIFFLFSLFSFLFSFEVLGSTPSDISDANFLARE